MARQKKTSEDVHNPPENSVEDCAPPSNSRHVNASKLADLLGYHRNTVMGWPKAGCPVVQEADVAANIAWVFDVADVVRWLRNKDVKEAVGKYATEDGETPEGISKAKKAKWAAIDQEIETKKNLRTIIPVKYVLDQISKDYADVRAVVAKIPDIIAANVEASLAAHVREIADKQVRNAMKSLQVKVVDDPLEYER